MFLFKVPFISIFFRFFFFYLGHYDMPITLLHLSLSSDKFSGYMSHLEQWILNPLCMGGWGWVDKVQVELLFGWLWEMKLCGKYVSVPSSLYIWSQVICKKWENQKTFHQRSLKCFCTSWCVYYVCVWASISHFYVSQLWVI